MSLGPVQPKETLARVLVHGDQVNRETRTVRLRAFMLSEGTTDISVHRRSHMNDEEAIRYAMMTVQPRGKTKIYGWAELSAEKAEEEGRQVFASPTDIQGHATIRLPPDAANDRELRKYHAQVLATHSRWVEPPAEFSAYRDA